jgi:hypothetical protein
MINLKKSQGFTKYHTISGFAPILIIVIIAFLISGGVGLFLYKTQYKSGKTPTTPVDETPERRPTEALDEAESEITSVDETWNLYTNNVYGFSIKFPKEMMHGFGAMCEWKEDGEDHSYRPNPGSVPTKVFEDYENKTVYISSEYFYFMSGETREGGRSYYSECNRLTNSLSLLTDDSYFQQQDWDFVYGDVTDDDELDAFIKERYGEGCEAGERQPTDQEGVYDLGIGIEGVEGTSDLSLEERGELGCVINYRTVLKYYPDGNKVVSWNPGQAYTFYKVLGVPGEEDVIYDDEMIESFRFLE